MASWIPLSFSVGVRGARTTIVFIWFSSVLSSSSSTMPSGLSAWSLSSRAAQCGAPCRAVRRSDFQVPRPKGCGGQCVENCYAQMLAVATIWRACALKRSRRRLTPSLLSQAAPRRTADAFIRSTRCSRSSATMPLANSRARRTRQEYLRVNLPG